MAAEQVFDPNLGEPRDAFPGEVVAPEQEKTLQRLMREERERFTSDLAEVQATGKLSPSDEDAVRRFADLRAEIKRKEYLDALNSNPASLLQDTLKEFKPEENFIIKQALLTLDKNVVRIQNGVVVEKASDKMRAVKQNTLQNVNDYLKKFPRDGNILTDLDLSSYASEQRRVIDGVTFELIKKLGLLPIESLTSFTDLKNAVQSTSVTTEASGSPYYNGYAIGNLSSNKPGLEGIKANIIPREYDFKNIRAVQILGSPEALARIVDKGQYVPYQSGKT